MGGMVWHTNPVPPLDEIKEDEFHRVGITGNYVVLKSAGAIMLLRAVHTWTDGSVDRDTVQQLVDGTWEAPHNDETEGHYLFDD